ncbi:hypothetical protein BJV74DRAFT_165415 [Russula compacta]|nr:hypothetical protein BJV74DRAFT_165415 [Russula compacta]
MNVRLERTGDAIKNRNSQKLIMTRYRVRIMRRVTPHHGPLKRGLGLGTTIGNGSLGHLISPTMTLITKKKRQFQTDCCTCLPSQPSPVGIAQCAKAAPTRQAGSTNESGGCPLSPVVHFIHMEAQHQHRARSPRTYCALRVLGDSGRNQAGGASGGGSGLRRMVLP